MKAAESPKCRNLAARLYGGTFQKTKISSHSLLLEFCLCHTLVRLTNEAQTAKSEVLTAVLVKIQVFWLHYDV
jgi:hypothetical protein